MAPSSGCITPEEGNWSVGGTGVFIIVSNGKPLPASETPCVLAGMNTVIILYQIEYYISHLWKKPFLYFMFSRVMVYFKVDFFLY